MMYREMTPLLALFITAVEGAQSQTQTIVDQIDGGVRWKHRRVDGARRVEGPGPGVVPLQCFRGERRSRPLKAARSPQVLYVGFLRLVHDRRQLSAVVRIEK